MGDYQLVNGIAKIRLDVNLIKPHFEETAAHELIHALEDSESWPITSRTVNLPYNSPEAIVGSELGAGVRDLHVYDTLKVLGFGSEYSNDARYRNSKKELVSATIPQKGSPMHCIWILRYCFLAMTQRPNRWVKLKEMFLKRAPSIAIKGEELIGMLKNNGWSTPDQALNSMIAMRDSLGLTKAQVIILDKRTGNRF